MKNLILLIVAVALIVSCSSNNHYIQEEAIDYKQLVDSLYPDKEKIKFTVIEKYKSIATVQMNCDSNITYQIDYHILYRDSTVWEIPNVYANKGNSISLGFYSGASLVGVVQKDTTLVLVISAHEISAHKESNGYCFAISKLLNYEIDTQGWRHQSYHATLISESSRKIENKKITFLTSRENRKDPGDVGKDKQYIITEMNGGKKIYCLLNLKRDDDPYTYTYRMEVDKIMGQKDFELVENIKFKAKDVVWHYAPYYNI